MDVQLPKTYHRIQIRKLENSYHVSADYIIGFDLNKIHDKEEYAYEKKDDAVKKVSELMNSMG